MKMSTFDLMPHGQYTNWTANSLGARKYDGKLSLHTTTLILSQSRKEFPLLNGNPHRFVDINVRTLYSLDCDVAIFVDSNFYAELYTAAYLQPVGWDVGIDAGF